MNRTIRTTLLLSAAPLLCGVLAFSQQAQTAAAPSGQAVSDQDIQMLRQDIRSQKKQIIAQNMTLTDPEAQKFWPIYDRFTADLVKINDTKYDLIKQYAQSFNQLTDAQVQSWTEKWLQLDVDVTSLRKKYLPEFQKVLPAKKVALYEQLDRRTQLMIDLQLASQIPLMPIGQ
jgi:hypothetical protein